MIKLKEKNLQELYKQIGKMKKSLDNKYFYKTKDLLITAPIDYAELAQEGKKLKHCVASYGERVSNKQTIILFIRKVSEPTVPYFTLELNPTTLEVKQCRGLCNRGYPEDVKTFISQWLNKKVLKNINTAEIKSA